MTLSTKARCGACQAPIAWRKDTRDRSVPLDVEPSEQGGIIVVDMLALLDGEIPDALGERYADHRLTCSKAHPQRLENP